MNALPLWSHPTLKKEDYAYFECSDKIHFPKNQWGLENLSEAPLPICLSFTNRFSQTISGSIDAQYKHDVDDTIFVPNWMYALLTTTDNLTVGFLCRNNCTNVTLRPQDPYLLTSDWMSRLPSAFTGYVTIQRYTTIPIWYDSRIIKVFIEDIQPNVDTVILQTHKSANVVLLPPCPVDDEFFRKFMNNRNQIQSIGDFFIPFSGTAYSLKTIPKANQNQNPNPNPNILVESPLDSKLQEQEQEQAKAKEHAGLFLQGLSKRGLTGNTVAITDLYKESKQTKETTESNQDQLVTTEQTHAQLFLSALKARQNRRIYQSVERTVLTPAEELKINMLEVQNRSKEEIDKTEFMALVARGRRDNNFAKIHREYLMKKYNVVLHKK